MKPDNAQTIELTSKRWEKIKLIGILIWLIGFISGWGTVIYHSLSNASSYVCLVPLGIIIIGLSITIYASIMSWWHHG